MAAPTPTIDSGHGCEQIGDSGKTDAFVFNLSEDAVGGSGGLGSAPDPECGLPFEPFDLRLDMSQRLSGTHINWPW